MKLYCPHCKSPVGSPPISPSDGFLDCHNCRKSFRIIAALEHAPEITRVRREAEFRSGIVNTASGTTFYFRGKKSLALLAVYFSLGFGLFLSAIVNFPDYDGRADRFISAVVGLVFLFSALWTITEQEELQIRAKSIIYTKANLGLHSMKVQPCELFTKLYEDVEYDSYNKPSFYLRMEFSNGQFIRFAKNLTHNERVWLIGEIYDAINGKK